MKKTTFISLLLMSFSYCFCQTVFKTARFSNIKQFNSAYLSKVIGIHDHKIVKYVTGSLKGFLPSGIAYHDISGNIKMILGTGTGHVTDFQLRNNNIYVLSTLRDRTKVDSETKLYEKKYDLKGKLLSKKLLSHIKVQEPNADINAIYDEKGQIWTLTEWSSVPEIEENGKIINGSPKANINIKCHTSKFKLKNSCMVSGEYLRLSTKDVFKNRIGFIFGGNDLSVNSKQFNFKDVSIYLEFNTSGKIIINEILGRENLYPEYLQLIEDGMFVGGEFQGNDTLNYEPVCKFRNELLSSPKNKFREETARNGFIAHLNEFLELNWINTIGSYCDVMIKSMSIFGNEIAVCLEYNDSINIDNTYILPARNASEYEYSDDLICFFHTNGKLKYTEQLIGTGYEDIEIRLTENNTILYGSFLNTLDFFDFKFKHLSNRSSNFLIFTNRELKE